MKARGTRSRGEKKQRQQQNKERWRVLRPTLLHAFRAIEEGKDWCPGKVSIF